MNDENAKSPDAGKAIQPTFRTRSRKVKFKVSFETADAEFAKFQDCYELYADEVADNVLEAFLAASEKLIIAVQKGVLKFNEDGSVEQTFASGQKATYSRLKGSAKVQDHGMFQPNDSPEIMRVRRMHSMMGALSGLGYEAMQQLEIHDLAIMECLAFLLLMV